MRINFRNILIELIKILPSNCKIIYVYITMHIKIESGILGISIYSYLDCVERWERSMDGSISKLYQLLFNLNNNKESMPRIAKQAFRYIFIIRQKLILNSQFVF